MVPPFDLITNKQQLLEDLANFHGKRGSPLNNKLVRTSDAYILPTL
jgi:hypothetical protein